MDRALPFQHQPRGGRLLPGAAVCLTLLILGGTIGWGTLHLRSKIRQQMLSREAEILNAVALMRQIAGQADHDLGGRIEDLADQVNVALEVAQLKGVIAARLFDANGDFVIAFPAYVTPGRLPAEALRPLQSLKPFGRFLAHAGVSNYVTIEGRQALSSAQAVPLLEVAIPLHRQNQSQLVGIIQFAIDGQPVAAEFRALDRHLWFQAGLGFLAGGGILAGALGWAFRKLNRSHRLLMQRTERLQQANEELAMAAKTSALGAVTAHLIHGLSNPLSGLRDFMASRENLSSSDIEWQCAMTSTRRMQDLVEDVTRVLNEEHTADYYEIHLGDLIRQVESKCAPAIRQARVRLVTSRRGDATLTNREVNLLALILQNVVQNGLEATPPGHQVELAASVTESQIVFRISDQGGGLSEQALTSLFRPCHSNKEGGSGIGLAICKQLAGHLGAQLTLQESGPSGCIFCLAVPRPVPSSKRRREFDETRS
jgi:signal transduction histidine kinase